MKWLRKTLSNLWPILILITMVVAVAFTNPLPIKGWLTGWDNLHPEFWPEMNIARSISAVWQEYQGVGLLGGMGHAADLFRQTMLWIWSLILPVNWLRHTYHLLMYLMGMIGMYILLEQYALQQYDVKSKKIAGLMGALYYALNLGTILYFYVPFEPYSTFWGMMPWEIYILIRCINNLTKKNIFWLVVINVFAVAQGYVQTLFLIYVMLLFVFLVIHIFREKSWKSIVQSLVIGMIIFAVNAFWVIPGIYYATKGVEEHNNSTQISFATEMFYLMNKGRGKISDLVPMKLFYADFTDWTADGAGFDYLAPAWINYYQNQWVLWFTYFLMTICFIGIFSKTKYKAEFLIILFVGAIGFLSAETGISQLNEHFRNSELFAQLFRNPYTKLIVPTVFSMSVFISLGTAMLMRWKIGKVFGSFMIFIVFAGLSKPIWQGEFFYRSERIEIPVEYIQLFDFMKNSADPSGRIALLPAHYIWGWANHDWGYRGSGFLWYGIEQPILDRAFDVWSLKNEGFYYEFSNALYGKDENRLKKVMEKYGVRYILLDKSIIDTGFDNSIFGYDTTDDLMKKLMYQKVFESKFLTVWDTRIEAGTQFVSAPSSYAVVDADTNKVRKDAVFEQLGTYVSNAKEVVVTYPFANLIREEVKGVEYGEGKVTISYEETPPAFGVPTRDFLESPVEESPQLIVPGWKTGDIVRIQYKDGVPVPAYFVNGQSGPIFLGKEKPEEGKDTIYAKVSEGKEWVEYLSERRFVTRGQDLKVEVPSVPQVYDFETMGQGKIVNCDVLKRGVAEKIGTSYIADGRGAACDYIEMKEIDPRMSYLMRFQGNNLEGRSLKYFLYNTMSKRNDIEYLLGKNKYDQTFSVLPWEWDGNYTLNIETRSFGQRAENLIHPIEVRWFPLEQIAGAKIIPSRSDLVGFENSVQPTRSDLRVTEVTKTGTWLYRVKVEGSGLLKLSQGYDDGWVSRGLQHVEVDGWANGWIVPQSGEATIFYWPQLLEYLGFVILGTTIVIVLFHKK